MTPRQIPFAPAAGFVGLATVKCEGGDHVRPATDQVCPTCGFEPRTLEGTPYPQGAWTRYRWVYDQDIENVIAKAVLLALVHHDRPGGSIFPSQARLCRMIGNTKGQYPERSIGRAVKWLEKEGWIVRTRRHNRGQRISDRFAIHHPAESLQDSLSFGSPDRESEERGRG